MIIHGRSDSTLNRQGVRMGSADIYEAVERLPEIKESLVIGVEQPDGGYWMPLFVHLPRAPSWTTPCVNRIKQTIRDQLSPRHVPDEIIEVPGIPHTLTGKRLEVPVKRLLQGAAWRRRSTRARSTTSNCYEGLAQERARPHMRAPRMSAEPRPAPRMPPAQLRPPPAVRARPLTCRTPSTTRPHWRGATRTAGPPLSHYAHPAPPHRPVTTV